MNIVTILNSISSQVYAFGAILVGCFLAWSNHDIGREIILAGFTLLNPKQKSGDSNA